MIEHMQEITYVVFWGIVTILLIGMAIIVFLFIAYLIDDFGKTDD